MRQFAVSCGLLAICASALAQDKVLYGVTFANEPGTTYVALKEVGFAFGIPMRSEGKTFYFNEVPVTTKRTLLDGSRLIPVRELKNFECTIQFDSTTNTATITRGDQSLLVQIGEKRIEVNKKAQLLRAYQGDKLVAETRVSTGRKGYTTPSGSYTAGPEKSRMRYSRKYNNSPMPYSIQIHGGYFMHGYTSVPKYPASHGCIRLPMWGANAAQWLWNWTDLGTPIVIADSWSVPDDSAPATLPVDLKSSTGVKR
jgi:lipoprotein-anchoring transpeptidase ErfK/SrfK